MQDNSKYYNSELMQILRTTIDALLVRDQQNVAKNQHVSEDNVFQPARNTNRELIFSLVEKCLNKDSGVVGLENWDQFIKNYKAGQSSLIFAEHKSNLDVIIFNYLMTQAGSVYGEIFNEIVFIAGRRLNEDSLIVKLFAEMYTRLIVVAKNESSEQATEQEQEQVYKINYATQMYIKNNSKNHIYFVYPTGTRGRIWDLSTFKVLTEAINYLRKFDQIIFMSMDGNCMFPIPNVGMDSEPVIKDTITMRFSKPYNVKELIAEAQGKFESLEENEKAQYDNIKSYLAHTIEQYIYGQKPCLPWQEPWVNIYNEMMKNL